MAFRKESFSDSLQESWKGGCEHGTSSLLPLGRPSATDSLCRPSMSEASALLVLPFPLLLGVMSAVRGAVFPPGGDRQGIPGLLLAFGLG